MRLQVQPVARREPETQNRDRARTTWRAARWPRRRRRRCRRRKTPWHRDGTPRETRRPPRASGTATPTTSSASISHDPGNGMSMWKARATAHVSPQMTSHSTSDQPRLASSRSGRRSTPSPDANNATAHRHGPATHGPAESARPPGTQTLQPVRMVGEHEHHDERDQRHRRHHEAAETNRRNRARIAGGHAGVEPEEISGSRSRIADQIEDPLDDDRREGGRHAEALAPRQQIGPQHLAGAHRQAPTRPRNRSRWCGTRRRSASCPIGFEQVLPALGPTT